jgi:hypothetical protein
MTVAARVARRQCMTAPKQSAHPESLKAPGAIGGLGPVMGGPQIPDSPAAFLESWRGLSVMAYR